MTESCNKTGEVRLANGEYESEGRLEICANGVWGTVCNNYNRRYSGFDLHAAAVACRQLGYSGYGELATWSLSVQCNYWTRTIPSGVIVNVFFGEGSFAVPIHLDRVDCDGTESNLLECSHNPIGENDCAHDKDVGIMCEQKQGSYRVLLLLYIHAYNLYYS